jgi:hypothetical protein
MGMQPVTLSYIPRDGEYDVICHHCTSSVDSLHQSISERNADSPRSAAGQTKSCPGAFVQPAEDAESPAMVTRAPLLEPFSMLGQPLLNPTIQNPFCGLYMCNLPTITPNVLGVIKPVLPPTQSSSASEPLPGVSPNSSKDSRPGVNASVHASLTGVTRRASLGKGENQDPKRPSTAPPLDPAERTPAELEAIASAIAASLCGQSATESLAETISITAAVEMFKQRKGITSLCRGHSVQRSVKTGASLKTHWSNGSSHKAHIAASKRRVKVGRRRTGKPKKRKSKSPKADRTAGQPQPEQVNSDTKRRDRREKLLQRQREADSRGSYHDLRISHGRSGAPHR